MFQQLNSFWLKWRLVVVSSVVCLAVGGLTGRYLTPVKTKTETIEKVVEKQATTADKTITTKQIKHPDGTVETDVIKTDVTTSTSVTAKTEDKKAQINQPAASSMDPYRPNWSIGGSLKLDWNNLLTPSYVFSGGYRILGNMWSGASFYTQDHSASVDLRVEF